MGILISIYFLYRLISLYSWCIFISIVSLTSINSYTVRETRECVSEWVSVNWTIGLFSSLALFSVQLLSRKIQRKSRVSLNISRGRTSKHAVFSLSGQVFYEQFAIVWKNSITLSRPKAHEMNSMSGLWCEIRSHGFEEGRSYGLQYFNLQYIFQLHFKGPMRRDWST